ncbi:ABEC1 enzyme, partial [Ptilonorhynchus violaceus]|nr:ABEC1 enzyme [Ptilonorhynchus violaceus]
FLKFLFCFSMYISRRTLRNQFDPRNSPPETYLLCELQWGERGRPWIHWLRNKEYKSCHAEVYFLREIFELRQPLYVNCYMTWYLSWSPCADCCYEIRDFLTRHPNVYIDIHVARLYYTHVKSNRTGLRILDRLPTVNHFVSISPDYYYCWETFIQGDADDDSWPVNFQSEITRNRSQLSYILQVSTL